MPPHMLDELPTELRLSIVELCDLKGLIKVRSLSKSWRALVMQSPHVRINPTRRKLLDLYDFCLKSKSFRASRETVIPLLKPLDRSHYLERLSDKPLPEAFDMWIREWPAKAAFGYLWPGLDGAILPLQPAHGVRTIPEFIRFRRPESYPIGEADLFVDRKFLLQHGIQEGSHQWPINSDYGRFKVNTLKIQHDPYLRSLSGLYAGISYVTLIIANGQPWNGSVQYEYFTRPNRMPMIWQRSQYASWIEFMKNEIHHIQKIRSYHTQS
ncbi:hypothetical protein SLS58_010349 [Diplodia intermedia]|uniref:F-box domain-containing protein n=1 Tax=Diplodia intermedia TaxID=856260 RepID=A0ABR3T6L9_9PEZI